MKLLNKIFPKKTISEEVTSEETKMIKLLKGETEPMIFDLKEESNSVYDMYVMNHLDTTRVPVNRDKKVMTNIIVFCLNTKSLFQYDDKEGWRKLTK